MSIPHIINCSCQGQEPSSGEPGAAQAGYERGCTGSLDCPCRECRIEEADLDAVVLGVAHA